MDINEVIAPSYPHLRIMKGIRAITKNSLRFEDKIIRQYKVTKCPYECFCGTLSLLTSKKMINGKPSCICWQVLMLPAYTQTALV